MPVNQIQKDKEYTIVQQAMDQIKNLIITGQYKVGDKLPTEMELASRLGISRPSLREAIKLFNYLGVLESRVAKGTFVSSNTSMAAEALSWAAMLGEKSVNEMLEFFASQQLWCALTLARGYKNEPLKYEKYIKKMLDELHRCELACRISEAGSISMSTHRFLSALVSSSENSIVISMYERLTIFLDNVNRNVQKNLYSQDIVIYNLNRALMDAIIDCDEAAIQKVVFDRLEIYKNRINMPLPPPHETDENTCSEN